MPTTTVHAAVRDSQLSAVHHAGQRLHPRLRGRCSACSITRGHPLFSRTSNMGALAPSCFCQRKQSCHLACLAQCILALPGMQLAAACKRQPDSGAGNLLCMVQAPQACSCRNVRSWWRWLANNDYGSCLAPGLVFAATALSMAAQVAHAAVAVVFVSAVALFKGHFFGHH